MYAYYRDITGKKEVLNNIRLYCLDKYLNMHLKASISI